MEMKKRKQQRSFSPQFLEGTRKQNKAEGAAMELRQVGAVGRQGGGDEEGRCAAEGHVGDVEQQVHDVHVSIARGMGSRGDRDGISRLSGTAILVRAQGNGKTASICS